MLDQIMKLGFFPPQKLPKIGEVEMNEVLLREERVERGTVHYCLLVQAGKALFSVWISPQCKFTSAFLPIKNIFDLSLKYIFNSPFLCLSFMIFFPFLQRLNVWVRVFLRKGPDLWINLCMSHYFSMWWTDEPIISGGSFGYPEVP